MNMPFQPPLFDPLEDIERSIEQPILPGMEAFVDPLDSQLSAIESSIEDQPLFKPITPDPLHETLDRLETSIEQGSKLPELKPELGLPSEFTMPSAQEDLSPQMKFSGPASKPPVPSPCQMSFTRQYPLSVRRMSGAGTGSRNSGNSFDYYCHLRETSVSESDCGSCPDFDASELAVEGEEERCRHTFYYDTDN